MQELLIREGLGVIAQEVQLGILVNVKIKIIIYKIINLFTPLVLSSTLSQMSDGLNLSMLIFKVGLLTLM